MTLSGFIVRLNMWASGANITIFALHYYDTSTLDWLALAIGIGCFIFGLADTRE